MMFEKRVDNQIMNDCTYKVLHQKEEECLKGLSKIPEEYQQLIMEYTEACTSCSAWENTLAYRKGLQDCAELLKELFVNKGIEIMNIKISGKGPGLEHKRKPASFGAGR